MAEIFLVTGGARSGKSKFAEQLALKLGEGRAAYIATAQIFDEEMAYRVKLHKARRNNSWITFESPFNADKTISEVGKNFTAKNSDAKVIFVSNEVGAGIVPENKLARIFRDLAGLANQKIAAEAEKVFLTVAGYAIDIKQFGEKI